MERTFDTNERELASLIKKGKHLAFATIFDRYNRQMYTLAFRYLKNREMAEDAVQQVFINFWVNRHKIDEELNIRHLLFTSLKNHTLNIIRNNKKAIEKNYESLIESIYNLESEEEYDESMQMTALIDKAVEQLSPQRRQIFYLKIMEGFSNQQIAQKLGLSVNTVKVQYYHILKEIREFVGGNMLSYMLLVSYLFR
jgi:RNA polymerase sigma-70 factor (ECF subfamily)